MSLRMSWITSVLLTATALRVLALSPVVQPVAQTVSMPGVGDVADDICVWVHPGDGGRSVILGCNKSGGRSGGLYAFQLDGSRWKNGQTWRKEINWFSAGKKINNVDLCRGFVSGKEVWDIVATANRTDRTFDLFRVHMDAQGDFSRLENVGCIPIGAGFADGADAPYGLALALLDSCRCMAFASDKHGRVAQYELRYNEGATGTNQITGRRFDDGGRPWQISERDEEIEGMVVDVQRGVIYIASEKEGIFRYQLKDGMLDPKSKIVVDRVGLRLKADVEGLALYSRKDGTGYLLASSQGSNAFAVYQREFDGAKVNQSVNSFRIGEGDGIDAVQGTDGIEVISSDLGGKFHEGIFIAHDGEGESNYKLVPWSAIRTILKR